MISDESSPILNRSLSLDSISPLSTVVAPSISQQTSSLSLNNVAEIKDIESVATKDRMINSDFKKYDEPEAVMVEVEDDIEETASPLVTAHSLFQRHTPVYKYAEASCNDYWY